MSEQPSPIQPADGRWPSHHLAKLWALSPAPSYRDSVLRSVKRAQEIVRAHALTVEDVGTLGPAFWNMHCDPISHMDGAAATLATIQVNLVAGTLARYAEDRPSLLPLIRDLLAYDIMGQFCLTELAHGLDTTNLETTATLLPDGTFELHTPHPGAAKYMPPTNPCGVPCVAIVFAKLIVAGANHGIRPFLLPINDGHTMHRGITARLLPAREGSTPLNHCLTSFARVPLPPDALLGDAAADTSRAAFFAAIGRVTVGTLALAGMTLPSLALAPCIVARYSARRTVGTGAARMPILAFRTQHAPVLAALAQGFVLQALWARCTAALADARLDPRVRHAYAAVFKVTATQHVQAANRALSERCGAQGLFAANQVAEIYANVRGITIAEGDTLVISIRLASELLLGRYALPASTHPDSLLARHERALLDEHTALLRRAGHHRAPAFARVFLPRCEALVRAIGHRMAFDAALDAGLDARVADLYRASVVQLDAAWYCEAAGLSRAAQAAAEDAALTAALPLLDAWLARTGIEPYVCAPIASEGRWRAFVDGLETHVQASRGVEPLLGRL